MKKTYDSKFKSRVALEAMRVELTIAEIASKYQVLPKKAHGQSVICRISRARERFRSRKSRSAKRRMQHAGWRST